VLSEPQIQRFSRHILLREVGGAGQEALLAACVRVPTLDAAGRVCALWLARSGVGALELPESALPAPATDEAGLLLACDAGQPVSAVIHDRLRFHRPELRFETNAPYEAAPGGDASTGALAALAIVRRILQERLAT
jgi:hypothetical protein